MQEKNAMLENSCCGEEATLSRLRYICVGDLVNRDGPGLAHDGAQFSAQDLEYASTPGWQTPAVPPRVRPANSDRRRASASALKCPCRAAAPSTMMGILPATPSITSGRLSTVGQAFLPRARHDSKRSARPHRARPRSVIFGVTTPLTSSLTLTVSRSRFTEIPIHVVGEGR